MKKTIGIVICCVVMLFGACFTFFRVNTFSRVSASQIEENDLKEFLEFEKEVMNLTGPDNLEKTNYKLFAASDTQSINEEILELESEQNKFALKRLIVQGSIKDTYGAINKISYKDLSILCYASESETSNAYKNLLNVEGVNVVPDKIESIEEYAEKDYGYTSYKNWGPKAMDIGGYRQFLVDKKVSKEAVVVVLDTGINTSHPMFSNRLLKDANGKIRGFSYHQSNYQYSYSNLAFDVDNPTTIDVDEGDYNKYSFEDDHSHGTHVAGIICDMTPSNVKILPIKIGDAGGFSNTSVIQAAYLRVVNIYSKKYNIVSTNLSFSGAGKSDEDEKNTFNTLCYEPLLELNIVPVTSAGNDSFENNVEDLKAVVVSSMKENGVQYEFDKNYSDYGKFVDIAAPGTLIYSAGISSTDSASSTYVTKSGTSMASPQVAGMVALLWLNPTLSTNTTANDIEQMLYDNAVDLGISGKDIYYGYGMANIRYFEVEDIDATLSFYRDSVLVDDYIEYENFEDDFDFEIRCSDPTYNIIYTTDKTYPTYNNNIKYSSSIIIDENIYIFAMGVKIVNDQIVAKTPLYNISYFDIDTPLENCIEITTYGYLYNYTGNYKSLTIPSQLKGYTVKTLSNNLFRWSNLESITLPDTIQNFGEYVFAENQQLKFVYAPGVTMLGKGAFSQCISLSQISNQVPSGSDTTGAYFPDLLKLSGETFLNCINLEIVDLPKLTTLGTKGKDFYNCKSLSEINLPSITSIPEFSFVYCESLTGTYLIQENIASIGSGAFIGCNITNFKIDPNNLNFYTDGYGVYSKNSLIAFATGTQNINYSIASTVAHGGQSYDITYIASYSIQYSDFNQLTIPESITSFGLGVFYSSTIGELYYNAINTEVVINWGNTPTYYSFGESISIDYLEIGKNVEEIPEYLFYKSNFKTLVINSHSTIFNSFSLGRKSGEIEKLFFNFTEIIDAEYLSAISDKAHLLVWADLDTLFSRVEVPVSEHYYFDHLIYSNYDGEYYVYSEDPLITQYKITASSNEYGTITPSGVNYVEEGGSITFRFTPNRGCYIKSIIVDDLALDASALQNVLLKGYTFEDVTENHNIRVTFAINKYKINVTQVTNGTISEAQANYDYGTSATFTITPDPGYHIEYLLVDGIRELASTEYTFEDITANHTLSAHFEPNTDTKYVVKYWKESLNSSGETVYLDRYYTLVLESEGAGTTGELTNASAESFDGFTVQSFTQETILGNGSTVIDIYYNRNLYDVTLLKSDGVAEVFGAGTYRFGERVDVLANLTEGYDWNGWTSDDADKVPNSTETYYSFVLPADNVRLTANATIKTFRIFTQIINGNISPYENQVVEYGGSVTFIITPDEGCELSSLLLDGEDVSSRLIGNTYTLSDIKDDHTLKVEFAYIMCDIVASCSENGYISPIDTATFIYGSTITYDFYPDEGYKVKDVVVDGYSKGSLNSYTFEKITRDYTIYVKFEKITLNISVDCGENGTIDPSGIVDVAYGDNATFTITPNEGYSILSIKVDGENIEVKNTIIIKNVIENKTLEVRFAPAFMITSYSGKNGTISPSAMVVLGNEKRFDITADTGYKVKDVKIDGVSMGAITSYTFKNVEAAHTISVEFEIQKFKITLNSQGEGSVDTTEALTDIPYGEKRTFVLSPIEGWKVETVYVNGVIVDVEDNKLVFDSITEDISITVIFAEKTKLNIDFNTILIYGATGLSGIVVLSVIVKNIKNRKRAKSRSKLKSSLASGTNIHNSNIGPTNNAQVSDKMLQEALEFVKYKQDHFITFCTKFNIDYKNNYNGAALKYYQAYLRSKGNNPPHN